MKSAWLFLVLVCCAQARAADLKYEGTWKATNRKLDGVMTCTVKSVGKDQWEAQFAGRWQGSDFNYRVKCTGPANDVRGQATIDGASYNWSGAMDADAFRGSFTGSRYTGHFEL